jgi:hypothetical protein
MIRSIFGAFDYLLIASCNTNTQELAALCGAKEHALYFSGFDVSK